MFMLILAAVTAACPFPADQWTRIATKHALPLEAVRVFGDLAEKGEPFQASDALPVGAHPPFSRFVSAQALGCDLVINYEHGGIAHGYPTARLRFQAGHWILVSRG